MGENDAGVAQGVFLYDKSLICRPPLHNQKELTSHIKSFSVDERRILPAARTDITLAS